MFQKYLQHSHLVIIQRMAVEGCSEYDDGMADADLVVSGNVYDIMGLYKVYINEK